jgi:hypothetical protein
MEEMCWYLHIDVGVAGDSGRSCSQKRSLVVAVDGRVVDSNRGLVVKSWRLLLKIVVAIEVVASEFEGQIVVGESVVVVIEISFVPHRNHPRHAGVVVPDSHHTAVAVACTAAGVGDHNAY